MKIFMGSCALIISLCSSFVFASNDITIKIEGAKGTVKTAKCPDGACVIDNLKADVYEVSTADSSESIGRKSPIEVLELQAAVMAPRDAGSGLATGRRQYNPVLIRKDSTETGKIVVTEDGSKISFIGVTGASVSSATNSAAPVMPKTGTN